MKRLSALSLLICVTLAYAERQLVNEVVAVIYHEMGTVAVLASDVRPALDGHMQTLREVILNRLMELDALAHKIFVTPQEAEKYIESIQKQNRLSRKAVEALFKEVGYTYEQALEYLRSRQMIEQVVEFRVKSDKRMMVSRADAEKRYNENPIYTQAQYTLAIAFIPSEQIVGFTIENYLKTIKLDTLKFDEPFELAENDIADDRKSIIQHKAGEIGFIEPVEDGYEITRLIKKTPRQLKPLDDCYPEIVTQMRQERLKEVFNEYYTLLFSQATIRFTHPQDAKVLESTEVV